MKVKTVNYYEMLDNFGKLADLRSEFKRSISRYGVPYFEADSKAEENFLEYCRKQGIGLSRKVLFECLAADEVGRGYIYLCIKSDSKNLGMPLRPAFFDYSKACQGGGS
jgi:hypothetical protein